MKNIIFLATLIWSISINAQNSGIDPTDLRISLAWDYGGEVCKKCYNGNISKSRKCDNCNGKGQINFAESCNICNGKPGACKEKEDCKGDCHQCAGDGETLGDGIKSKCPECSGSGNCVHCRGQGHLWGRDCKFCDGNGKCHAANNCYGSGYLLKYPSIKCSPCKGTGKCLNRYPSNDYKCHGTGEIHFTVQKNPNITQADKDELAAYIVQAKLEEDALEQKRKEEAELKAKEAALKIEKVKMAEAESLNQSGNQFFNQNKFDEALNYYNQSLNVFPSNDVLLKKQRVLNILDSIKTLGNYEFNYLDFPKTGIADFQKNYKNQIFNYYSGPSATCKVIFSSNGKGKLGLSLEGIGNKKLSDSIIAKPFQYPKPAARYGYYVNAKTTFEYKIKTETKPLIVAVKDKKMSVHRETYNTAILKNQLPDSNDGKYQFNVGTISIDSITKEMLPQFVSYKSYGGPGMALFSVLVPGLGKSIITRSPKGIGTLLCTGGFAAAGFYLKNKADANYNLYMKAQTQTDMDSYYDKYKNNMVGMKLCIGTAAAIWLMDIYTVYHQGKYNQYKERKLTPSFSVNNNQKSFNIAISIK